MSAGALYQPRCSERKLFGEGQQTEAACGLISHDHAVTSFSDLNLGELEPPLSGDLPPLEAQRGEVLQQPDKQVTRHQDTATQAVGMSVPPCGGISIEVEQQETTMFFREIEKCQSAFGATSS